MRGTRSRPTQSGPLRLSVRRGGAPAGYQAGIDDIGNGDDIHNNDISGAGYAPDNPPPAFVRPIDITSFPTTNPKVHNNTFNGAPYNG